MIGQRWKASIAICILATIATAFVGSRSSGQEGSAIDGALDSAMSSVVVVNADDRSGAAFLCITNQWVATSLHVVLGTKNIAIHTDDEQVIAVDGFCLADETKDLVLLHLEKPLNRKPLRLVPQLPAVGSEIYAIGNPHGLGGTVTKGIISGIRLGRQLKKVARDPLAELILRDDEPWVQFDAPIQPGNSGGPIVDSHGAVVGIVSRGLREQDISFASPVVTIAQLSPQSSELKPKPVDKMHEDCAKFWELVQHLASVSVDTKFMWLRGTAELREYFRALGQAADRTKQIDEEDERRRDWVQRRFVNDSVNRSIETARCFDRWIVKHQTIFLTQLVGSDKMLAHQGVLSELYPKADAELVEGFQNLVLKTKAYRQAVWQQHALFWEYVNAEGEDQRQEIAAKCKQAWGVINDSEKQLIDAGKVCLEMKEKLERRFMMSFDLPSEGEAAEDEEAPPPSE